jgi:hypothetical protein
MCTAEKQASNVRQPAPGEFQVTEHGLLVLRREGRHGRGRPWRVARFTHTLLYGRLVGPRPSVAPGTSSAASTASVPTRCPAAARSRSSSTPADRRDELRVVQLRGQVLSVLALSKKPSDWGDFGVGPRRSSARLRPDRVHAGPGSVAGRSGVRGEPKRNWINCPPICCARQTNASLQTFATHHDPA